MTETNNGISRVAFIGFGEAGAAIVQGWGAARPASLSAYDVKPLAVMTPRYAARGVAGAETLAEALRGRQAAFSVVTADQAVIAAESAAASLPEGAFWFDCNSCSPGAKRRAAAAIEAAGGRYVDVAVMAPVHPKLHRVPLLVAGPHAAAAEAALLSLDMKPTIAGETVGQASSIKMIRSVMIKGMEALAAECFLAARRAGVEESVIASLEASNPDIDWRRRGVYNFERMMEHGMRRAAEMREAAATVRELGLSGAMSAATADWEATIGALGLAPGDGADASAAIGEDALLAHVDRVLARL